MSLTDREILNSFGSNIGNTPNLLAKALTSATGVGEALSPQSLRQAMTLMIQRLSPEMMIYMKYGSMINISSKFREYNTVDSLPASGSAMGELTTTDSNSQFSRKIVELKKFRRKGKVSDFVSDISRDYADPMQIEMNNQLRVLLWDMVASIYFGNATSNVYDINGLENVIATNRNNGTFGDYNVRGGKAISSLQILDDMIDAADLQGGGQNLRVFLASPELVSTMTRYETTIRKNITLDGALTGGGLGKMMIPGGTVMDTYRGVPIVKTSHLAPRETMTPTITLASGGTTGGFLSNGDYYIQIAPITNRGEQLASTEQSITLSGGGSTQKIKITLSAKHADALQYKIYMSQTTATEKLVRQVTALYYDSDGMIDSTKANGVGVGNEIYILNTTASAEIPAHMQNDVPLIATGSVNPEYLILHDLDPVQGLGEFAYTNINNGQMFSGLVTTAPLAKMDAYQSFLLYSHMTLTPAFEKTSVIVRGIRKS